MANLQAQILSLSDNTVVLGLWYFGLSFDIWAAIGAACAQGVIAQHPSRMQSKGKITLRKGEVINPWNICLVYMIFGIICFLIGLMVHVIIKLSTSVAEACVILLMLSLQSVVGGLSFLIWYLRISQGKPFIFDSDVFPRRG
jgi:hypothetical protein